MDASLAMDLPMELSILKLQDPLPTRSVGERRSHIRHKLHSPVYASFSGPNAGLVLNLSELRELSEEGFSVDTNERLDVDQQVSFSLDLPETKAKFQSTGVVVWGNGTRKGIRFSGLSEQSKRALKDWLMVNLLAGSMKNEAQKTRAAAPTETRPTALSPVLLPPVDAPVPDPSGVLAAVEAVRREMRATTDFDAALSLITGRALSLTGAAGAALAFVTDDKMVCRASAGEPSMPLGTAVDVREGITGECVRSGRMVVCEDVETDSRVDREICRALGIGSILASPIVADFRVVGLLEVFSPNPNAFADIHETVLDRLVELVPKARITAIPAQDPSPNLAPKATESYPVESTATMNSVGEAVWEQEREAQEPLGGVPVRRNNLLVWGLTLPVLALVAGYVSAPKLAPIVETLWRSKPAAGSPAAAGSAAPVATRRVSSSLTLGELRTLANNGDAEAQWELGSRYRHGEGIPQDDVQAARWFQLAAEQGHLASQRAIGSSFWSGRGVPKNLSKAYFWSSVAANQGDEISASQMQGLAMQMTPAQVAAAQAQADDWLRQRRVAK
jgi:putative methionine-R-sulfoxide reductase with GAF domain